MDILTHLLAAIVGFIAGLGVICLLSANRLERDEHEDYWRDR